MMFQPEISSPNGLGRALQRPFGLAPVIIRHV
jgi:hypothetical protein